MSRITEQQKRFADEYLIEFNGTQAAIKAGYSEKYANRQAYTLLQNPLVQEYLNQRREELQERINITQEKVIKELAAVAFFNMTDVVKILEEDGRSYIAYIPTAALTEEQQKAISYIKKGRHGIEVKAHDKLSALKLLGEHLGIFKAKENNDNLDKLDEVLSRIEGKI